MANGMKMMKKIILWGLCLVFGLLILGLGFIKLNYGMGKAYPDVSTAPKLSADKLETMIETEFPPGMVASAPDGRLFFNLHMLHQPERFVENTMFEIVAGKAVPFPDTESQPKFYGAMGLTVDNFHRLWIIVPATFNKNHTRLLAIDIQSKKILMEHQLEKGTAQFAQDMRVSSDGKTLYMADTGALSFTSGSIIAFDIEARTSRSLLLDHPSVNPQGWFIRRQDGKPNRFFFGLINMTVGVDGIAISRDGEWLYYGAMNNDAIYRIRTAHLQDKTLSKEELGKCVEKVGTKPLSDGIELDSANNVMITDVENGGVAMLSSDGRLHTLVKKREINWSDSITVASDGAVVFTDSMLTSFGGSTVQPPTREQMSARAPYRIYRFYP
jgi:hypothetical protein